MANRPTQRRLLIDEAMSRAEATPSDAARPAEADRLRYLEFGTMLNAIDAAIGREDDGSSDARVAIAQTYATVWAAIGYGIWVILELAIRLLVALWRLLFRRGKERRGAEPRVKSRTERYHVE